MTPIALAIAVTLFAWWFGTGAIFWLNGLPRRRLVATMACASLLLVIALAGIAATADDTSVAGAYLAFFCGLMVWAWMELTFLTGLITGPNRAPAPAGLALAARFRLAVGAILWHELTIIALAAAVLALCWDAPNRIAASTVLILWAMRTSTKLNIFLGVRNTYAALLPPGMRYLASHFTAGRVSPLFVPTLAAAVLTAVLLFAETIDAAPFDAVGFAILGTLAALGAFEHVFLVVPVRSDALWGWSLGDRARPDQDRPPGTDHRRPRLDRTVVHTEAT